MRIIHDYYNRNDPSKIYLATPNKDILCALNSIDATSVDFVGKCNDLSTLTFTINRYTENSKGNRIEANGYELVSKYMRLYVTNVGWFIMDTPEIHSTGNIEYKTINASSAEIEFKQIPLDTWKVNKGTTDSLEMLVDGNAEEIDGVEFAKENIKFHNLKNKKLSLVDILVSKVYGWEVGYVDPIPKIYESFENGELVKTPVLLADEVGMFDISYSNAYAFMMQDLEKFFNCVVEFDYINFKVNFYRVENFGKDTSVTIGFRNVQNTSDITVDEDNIFTKFRVVGGNNLGIEQFNGGSNCLIILDKYWLNEKYLSPTTINKYNKWSSFCNIARYKYGEYSKEWNVLQEQIGELNTRVPNLDCNPENWDKLSDEELLNFKSDYEAQKLGYEKIYVDEEGHFDIDALNASPDANIYHQIVDTILPNIDIEIENRKLPTSEGETDFIETYKTTVRFSNLKLELGNKSTDWSPAPEDIQSSLNSSENKSNNALEQTSEVRSSIEILKKSIETLVTDENGQSLMTQTGNGWTFNMGAYQTIIDKVTSDITDVKGDVDEVNQLANNASQLVNDVAAKTAYINMSTDETGSPCIELGKSDNEFKLRITNTSIDFMQGAQRIAYITNQSLYIQSSVVTDEMKVGDESGYIWKKRSNGNMGLRYVS